MTTLLRDGYGFEEHSRNVTFALESEGMEVSVFVGERRRHRAERERAFVKVQRLSFVRLWFGRLFLRRQ